MRTLLLRQCYRIVFVEVAIPFIIKLFYLDIYLRIILCVAG